ncbi:MAG: HupE/UreJ family protein [Flavobacteriales bacterium]|nr:HupE/UreJ family protein [Flavobacteriales bacterium]
MSDNFFIQGIQHITDLEGYDHMLFLAALCAPFTFKEWKTVLLLATAFTVGHSVSLALSALELIHFNRDLIELLIAITILLTALVNVFIDQKGKISVWSYLLTTGFGIIHGMGFSGFFRMISDDTGSFIRQLLLFNLGVETGQILIIMVFLGIMFLAGKMIVQHRKLSFAVSLFSAAVAAWMVYGRI